MTRFFAYFSIAATSLVGLLVALGALLFLTTPRPTNIRSCLQTSMFHVRLCPREPGYVKLKDISVYMRNAVVVSEDGSFYSHRGLDWFELRESFEKNWRRGQFARGGSTITQQLAKNVYLGAEKSILRKVREAIIAVQIEDILSKDEILEKYLNVVEFGHGLYGVSRAARHYFEKSPADLTVAESAFLAFLLPSPEKYSVSFKHKELTPFARSQMKQIITRLLKFRKISQEEYDGALFQVATFFGAPAPEISEESDQIVEPSEEELPSDEIQDLID